MGQPVKISDELVLDARMAGKLLDRSIAGQIEFWAKMGRAIEPLLNGEQMLALCQSGATQSVSSAFQSINTLTGRKRLHEYLKTRPYPHYEAAPSEKGLLIQIDADGTRTLGRFVGRKFVPAKKQSRVKSAVGD